MDVRTATQLCMIELVPLIEAGDFRQFGAAERILGSFLASAPDDFQRSAFLGRLADDLAAIGTPDRPEPDAYIRALKAIARRQLQMYFDRAFRL